MYGAGLLSALLGIGSGALKIPAMDTALRLPIKVSSATSNFMIGVTAAVPIGLIFALPALRTRGVNLACPNPLNNVSGCAAWLRCGGGWTMGW